MKTKEEEYSFLLKSRFNSLKKLNNNFETKQKEKSRNRTKIKIETKKRKKEKTFIRCRIFSIGMDLFRDRSRSHKPALSRFLVLG